MSVVEISERRTPSFDAVVEVSAQKRDQTSLWLALIAIVVSVLSFIYFSHQGTILSYKDAVSHMEIAKRIFNSPTPGFGQLGGVWLPLPHLLMLPFVWNNWLYYNGLAGSLSSMVSYIVASVLLYKIIFDLTSKKLPALTGAFVFMANPNILYMQSTAMTELLLFACMLGMVYSLQRWIRTEEKKYLLYAGIASFLGTLSRYEAWVLFAAMLVVMFYVGWRKQYGSPYHLVRGVVQKRYRHQDNVLGGRFLAFLFVGGIGILGWVFWNDLILGNPLYFQDGQYAKPSLWVGKSDKVVGNWVASFHTYWYAMTDNLHLVIVVLMIVGLLVILVRGRLRHETLPALTLLVMFPFYVVALYEGQRPLYVSQVQHAAFETNNLLNVRFGLLMVLPASILIGYMVAQLDWKRHGKVLCAVGCAAVAALTIVLAVESFNDPASSIITNKEAVVEMHSTYDEDSAMTSQYLRHHYNGGLVLMESYGNEALPYQAHLSLGDVVYEGSYKLWNPTLANPSAHHIRWIVMRGPSQPDDVYKRLHYSPELSSYKLVYKNPDYSVYERN